MRADLNWDDLAWLRQQWHGPLFVKGILDPDDAERAADAGADGVVVSNHGGRQLNGTLATVEALPDVAARVGDRIEVLVDGGVRSGADVLKALALGARGVLVGRPQLYGLGGGGEAGVVSVLSILAAEMRRNLTLMGLPGTGALDRDALVRAGA